MTERVTQFRGGAGEPLLLIHGFTSFWETWASMLPALTQRFDVFAPTLLGHLGRPEFPELTGEDTVTGLLADDLEQQLDAAGIAKAHIVGNSLGGLLSMELLRRGRALSVVALSPAGGWLDQAATDRASRLFRSVNRMARLTRPFARLFMRFGFLRRFGLRPFALRGDRLTAHEVFAALDGMLAVDIDRFMPLTDERLSEYTDTGVPTLIAWADVDRTIPAPRYSDRWREVAPFAEYRTLAGVGHVPMIDDPDLVTRTVVDWINEATATDLSA